MSFRPLDEQDKAQIEQEIKRLDVEIELRQKGKANLKSILENGWWSSTSVPNTSNKDKEQG